MSSQTPSYERFVANQMVQAEKEEREEQEKANKAQIEAREAKMRQAALGPQGKKKVSKK